MPGAHWIAYVGLATGIVGSITGIAGSIMGYIAYRRSNKLKSLDLRLELRKSIKDAHAELSRLKKLIEDAHDSRKAVMVASGMFRSGAMKKWNDQVEADKARIEELFKSAPSAEATYYTLKARELESELVIVHALRGEIKSLIDKYSEAMDSDVEQRRQIREDQRTRRALRN